MAERTVNIRRYKSSEDRKVVLFFIAKSCMEGLATANRNSIFHPLTVSIWIALSALMSYALSWWPKPGDGFFTYLRPLPAFAAFAVLLFSYVDWRNRPHFEQLVKDVLKQPDLVTPDYYSPPSSFWIMDYGGQFVGLIAYDASASLEATAGRVECGRIRHFYVQEQYRSTRIQDDLLHHAIRQAASQPNKSLEGISAKASDIISYTKDAYERAGFLPREVVGDSGIYFLTQDKLKKFKED